MNKHDVPSDAAIWERVRRVFCEIFEDDDLVVQPLTTAADVERWDSVTNIMLMVALEREFDIRFRTGEMAALENVGQLVERITARLGEK